MKLGCSNILSGIEVVAACGSKIVAPLRVSRSSRRVAPALRLFHRGRCFVCNRETLVVSGVTRQFALQRHASCRNSRFAGFLSVARPTEAEFRSLYLQALIREKEEDKVERVGCDERPTFKKAPRKQESYFAAQEYESAKKSLRDDFAQLEHQLAVKNREKDSGKHEHEEAVLKKKIAAENVHDFVGKNLHKHVDKVVGEAQTTGEVGVARVEADKLAMEEGYCKPELDSVQESEGGGGGQDIKAAPIALKNEGTKSCAITVIAKSSAEEQYVYNLMHHSVDMLKLPEGATLVARTGASINDADGFDVVSYMRTLGTLQFGRLLLHARQLPSTHTLLSENFHAFPEGTVTVADVQHQGKGRGGNKWVSPEGCLMFSYTLQMEDGRSVPFLQYVVSLAVIEGIEAVCSSKVLKTPEVKIKWPNDLYAKGLKIGGVLCTSTYSSKKFKVVIGVGLNVANQQPTTCLDTLLHELCSDPPSLTRHELLAAILGRFEVLFNMFLSQGFAALESKYYQRWLHSGQTVELEESQEGSSKVSKVYVRIQGLTATGYLRAVDDSGESYELHPDGNSLDFLKGLVRKKM